MTRTMDPTTLPTLEQFKEFLSYDPETGIFTWIKSTGKKSMKPGDRAGHKKSSANNKRSTGYIQIIFRRKFYSAHRLAWLFVFNKWPNGEIDHINGIRDDNRILNLRDVTRHENMQNRASHRRGRLVGATFSKEKNKWRAQIGVNGKQTHIGYYETERDAHDAFLLKRVHQEKERQNGEI